MVLAPLEAYLPGYAAYLAAVFLPGIGFGELFALWDEDLLLIEKVAFSFGLGLAFDTFIVLVRTSGLTVGGFSLRGLEPATVYFEIAVGLATLVASLVRRRKFLLPSRPREEDAWVLFLIASLAAMVLFYFQKYPVFPEYYSRDFGDHALISQSLISGSAVSIPAGALYYGVHFQLASAIMLVGGDPFVTVQRTMALLLVLSPLLFYLAGRALFGRRLAGLVFATLYVFSGTVWFVAIFNSGLFPNFFGTLAALFLLVVVLRLGREVRSAKWWTVFFVTIVMTYFSHYTIITVFPALLLLPLLWYFKDRTRVVGYLAPAVVAVVPALVAVAFLPALVAHALSVTLGSSGVLSGSTYLSSALSAAPFFSYMALEVYADVSFVFLILFTAIYVYRGAVQRSVTAWIPLVWFASLAAAAPAGVLAWRFSYEAIIPLTFMAAGGIVALLPKPGRRSLRTRGKNRGTILVLLLILLAPLVLGSWTTTAMADAASNTAVVAEAQQAMYASFYWLKANTSASSGILGATDIRYGYTAPIIGRLSYTAPDGCYTDPSEVRKVAVDLNLTYIVVTMFETCALPPNPQLFLWNTLKPASNLTLVYSNDYVRIFKVV
jgi:hypothetical protein